MTETDTFDYGTLGEVWWLQTGQQLGANVKQIRFAAAKYRGCSNTQAYREAGYEAANEGGYRTGGYRLARANIIERLLAFAAGEGGEGYDGSVDRAEARRILSSLARGSDPSVRIRAIEQLGKMDDADQQEKARAEEPSDPISTLRLVAGISPTFAAEFALQHGISAKEFLDDPDILRVAESHLETLAFNWIRKNPARAKELADYFVRAA